METVHAHCRLVGMDGDVVVKAESCRPWGNARLDINPPEIWGWCAGEKMKFRRIDGTTALEDREKAIHDFNRKGSDVYVFLLSIRAAGRGLNLQVRCLVSTMIKYHRIMLASIPEHPRALTILDS